MNLPIHAGGKTALQMQGYAHYLPLGKGKTVSLFGLPNTRLPTWFRHHQWGVKISYITTRLFTEASPAGFTDHSLGNFSIRISAPERAIMEVLYSVPKAESYEEAKLLMEGLTTLRPRLVQALLEHCASVKVKRVFMVLAEASAHTWIDKLDLSKVDFGKGKRMLVKGGRFHAKYNISLPEVGA